MKQAIHFLDLHSFLTFSFSDVLSYQLEECQTDFFYEIEMDKSFLLHALKVSLANNITDKISYQTRHSCVYMQIVILYFVPLQTLSRNIDSVYSTSATPQKLHTLKRRFENFRAFLDKKFNWTWVRESRDEDEDEGEYAPVVVELDEDGGFDV